MLPLLSSCTLVMSIAKGFVLQTKQTPVILSDYTDLQYRLQFPYVKMGTPARLMRLSSICSRAATVNRGSQPYGKQKVFSVLVRTVRTTH